MKKIAYIALMAWAIFFLHGILSNFRNYNVVEFLVIIFVALVPFIVLFIYKIAQRKHDKSEKHSNDKAHNRELTSIPLSSFTSIQVETYNRQFKESYDIIMTSSNPETVIKRFQFINSIYSELKKTSDNNKSWQYCQNLYSELMSEKDTIVNNAIEKYYNNELSKVKNLKTQRAQSNHMKVFFERVKSLYGLTQTNEAFIENLYENTKDIYAEDNPVRSANELSNVELNFLNYIDGRSVHYPDIALYWSYEFDLDCAQAIKRFLDLGYLKVTTKSEAIEYLTIPELKDILRTYELKVSGKKAELIERIKENLATNAIEYAVPDSALHYVITKSGLNAIKDIKPLREAPKPLTEEEIKEQILSLLKSFREVGTNYYEFLATLDTETCPICGKLDKKVFHITAAEIGKNCPPMHDGCRCTVVPHIDDEFSDLFDEGKRAARDPKTGKTVYVPDMSYTEWKNKYLN